MESTTGKTALVIGATGLVGKALVRQLLEDGRYGKVVVFVRRETGLSHPKLQTQVIDFGKPETWTAHVRGDVLFSALGTTKAQAGSIAAQRVVDYDYQYAFARAAAANGVPALVLVSSVGADAHSMFPYTKMKGELDRDVQGLGFRHVQVLRPGPLAGQRDQPRGGEKWSMALIGAFNAIGLFRKYRPIQDHEVAKVMRKVAETPIKDKVVLEPQDLFALLGTAKS